MDLRTTIVESRHYPCARVLADLAGDLPDGPDLRKERRYVASVVVTDDVRVWPKLGIVV